MKSGSPLYNLVSVLLWLLTECFLWIAKIWQQHCPHRSAPSWILLSWTFHKADSYCNKACKSQVVCCLPLKEHKRSDWDKPKWSIRKLMTWRKILCICQQIHHWFMEEFSRGKSVLWISHPHLSGCFYPFFFSLFFSLSLSFQWICLFFFLRQFPFKADEPS